MMLFIKNYYVESKTMKRLLKVSILSSLLVTMIFLNPLDAAQTKKNLKKVTTENHYANVPFDVKEEKLPGKYVGHDYRKIYDALKRIKPKSEFEPTTDYEKRLAENATISLYGLLTVDSILAFSINQDLDIKYNADENVLTVSLEGDFYVGEITERGNYKKYAKFKLFEHYKKTGSYIGANAFNRKIQVEKGISNQYCIAFNIMGKKVINNSYSAIKGDDCQEFKDSIILPAAEASKAKDNTAILFIGKLRPPYLDYGYSPGNPKIDYPYDIYRQYYSILMDVSEIWIYNIVSGEIYKKIKAEQ